MVARWGMLCRWGIQGMSASTLKNNPEAVNKPLFPIPLKGIKQLHRPGGCSLVSSCMLRHLNLELAPGIFPPRSKGILNITIDRSHLPIAVALFKTALDVYFKLDVFIPQFSINLLSPFIQTMRLPTVPASLHSVQHSGRWLRACSNFLKEKPQH